MKLEKLPSGSYRVRKMYNKKQYSLVFDHKPTQKEVNDTLLTLYSKPTSRLTKTFREAALEYIESRSNVISPATHRGYMTLYRSISKDFADKNIYTIELVDIQNEINLYAKNHSPKSTRNYHGFVHPVMTLFRPDFVINTTLPQPNPQEPLILQIEAIKQILDASVDSKYHIAFQLGVLGLRRGEVAGLDINKDLDGNTLHIQRVVCESDNNGWVIKEFPKNETSNRRILLPDELVEEIHKQGYIVKTTPPTILNALHSYQDKLNIPRFRFHDLRHYFASYCHAMGIPDLYILQMGGWKTDNVLKRIYKNEIEEKTKEVRQQIAVNILN